MALAGKSRARWRRCGCHLLSGVVVIVTVNINITGAVLIRHRR